MMKFGCRKDNTNYHFPNASTTEFASTFVSDPCGRLQESKVWKARDMTQCRTQHLHHAAEAGPEEEEHTDSSS